MANTNKAQFNVTTAKDFRATMGKWANAHGDITEKILSKQDAVKARVAMIATNEDRIAKESVQAKKDAIASESAKFAAEIETLNAELAEYKKAQADRLAPALALVTDDIYNAYSAFIMDAENGELYEVYAQSVKKFFEDNGVVSGDATVAALCAKTGADKSSARYEFKNGTATKAMTKAKFREMFVRSLCDIMRSVNALPEFKYTYVLVKDRKNAK